MRKWLVQLHHLSHLNGQKVFHPMYSITKFSQNQNNAFIISDVQNTKSTQKNTFVTTVPSTDTSVTITSLSPNTTYSYDVAAIDSAGNTSSVVTIRGKTTQPAITLRSNNVRLIQ
ncbi:fibronectin type III domain-containing protein [Gottfriedia acidiceleris]|uniref:fibronectin type III domain-containing protein n=1 Tax=Gottfriedia acidiceleris TaxID=371036 RepID=UPI003D23510C